MTYFEILICFVVASLGFIAGYIVAVKHCLLAANNLATGWKHRADFLEEKLERSRLNEFYRDSTFAKRESEFDEYISDE